MFSSPSGYSLVLTCCRGSEQVLHSLRLMCHAVETHGKKLAPAHGDVYSMS